MKLIFSLAILFYFKNNVTDLKFNSKPEVYITKHTINTYLNFIIRINLIIEYKKIILNVNILKRILNFLKYTKLKILEEI